MRKENSSLFYIFLSLVILFLSACQTAPIPVRQSASLNIEEGWQNQKAIVVLAADFREKTSLRDNIPRFGSVFFRKVDTSYDNKSAQDYDFGVQYDVSADWKAVSGQRDDNRMPHLFQIDPGTYVIESIRIGGGPKTVRRGYDSRTNRVSYGTFTVRQGEVLNLGRLVVHMHFREGAFSQRVEDNAEEVLTYLTDRHSDLKGKLEKRMLDVVQKFGFSI